jgi:hypothetical protein
MIEGFLLRIKSPCRQISYLLILAVPILFLLPTPGTSDMNIWMGWKNTSVQNGLLPSYAANPADYPPISRLLLWAWPGAESTVNIKLLLLLMLLVSTAVYFIFVRSLAYALLLFVGLLICSVGLGYLDVLWMTPFLLSFFALQKGQLALSSVCLAIATSMKWQPMIVLPVLFLYVLLGSDQILHGLSLFKRCLQAFVPFFAYWIMILWIFGPTNVNAARSQALSQTYYSGNALNLPWIIGSILDIKKYGLRPFPVFALTDIPPQLQLATQFLFYFSIVMALVIFLKSNRDFRAALSASILVSLNYFFLSMSVHENHLFLAISLGFVALAFGLISLETQIILLLMFNFNLVFFYGVSGTGIARSQLFRIDISIILAVLYIFLYLIVSLEIVQRVFHDKLQNLP